MDIGASPQLYGSTALQFGLISYWYGLCSFIKRVAGLYLLGAAIFVGDGQTLLFCCLFQFT